jgi:hypothetical protein
LELAVLPAGVERLYRFDLNTNRAALAENDRLLETYLYDPAQTAGVDQLTSVARAGGVTSFGYDADGRTTARGGDTLAWDGWDRHTGGSFGGETVSYGFDATGFRRERTRGNFFVRRRTG